MKNFFKLLEPRLAPRTQKRFGNWFGVSAKGGGFAKPYPQSLAISLAFQQRMAVLPNRDPRVERF